jgi:hypothetical protein
MTTNYWLFTVTHKKTDHGLLAAEDILKQRLADRFWGLAAPPRTAPPSPSSANYAGMKQGFLKVNTEARLRHELREYHESFLCIS